MTGSFPRPVPQVGDATSALRILNERTVDAIFLDINMPGLSGLELASVLGNFAHPPALVFVTAHDDKAVAAFEVGALDYLLKPVTPERLQRALAKYAAAAEGDGEHGPGEGPRVRGRGERIFVRDGERCWFVRLADVRLLSVEGNATRLHFGRDSALLPRSLQYLEQRLDAAVFFRANRQQIVNLDWIERVDPWIGDGLRVVLKCGREVEVSRRQARELREMMEI